MKARSSRSRHALIEQLQPRFEPLHIDASSRLAATVFVHIDLGKVFKLISSRPDVPERFQQPGTPAHLVMHIRCRVLQVCVRCRLVDSPQRGAHVLLIHARELRAQGLELPQGLDQFLTGNLPPTSLNVCIRPIVLQLGLAQSRQATLGRTPLRDCLGQLLLKALGPLLRLRHTALLADADRGGQRREDPRNRAREDHGIPARGCGQRSHLGDLLHQFGLGPVRLHRERAAHSLCRLPGQGHKLLEQRPRVRSALPPRRDPEHEGEPLPARRHAHHLGDPREGLSVLLARLRLGGVRLHKVRLDEAQQVPHDARPRPALGEPRLVPPVPRRRHIQRLVLSLDPLQIAPQRLDGGFQRHRAGSRSFEIWISPRPGARADSCCQGCARQLLGMLISGDQHLRRLQRADQECKTSVAQDLGGSPWPGSYPRLTSRTAAALPRVGFRGS
mmetsp:Transcript_28390/g.70294  ORF Transcript_28390/g.70294 Transcript_28390/m.70294 type:complete len:445 (+) Transcript_28390:214-1548(+)